MNKLLAISEEVAKALEEKKPVVALESALLTHGLPHPENIETTFAMAQAVREADAIPAVIAIANGEIRVGADEQLIQLLGEPEKSIPLKVNLANLAVALANGRFGGTTVAATLKITEMAGIRVFATGGIGGVHYCLAGRENIRDVSADLPALQKHPCIVVSSGAKVLLDLEATREELETRGVPLLGWRTVTMPEFICPPGLIECDAEVYELSELPGIARRHWSTDGGALLFTVPCPSDVAVEKSKIEAWLKQLETKMPKDVRGTREATPWMLAALADLSGEVSKRANKALLVNNAGIAGKIAVEFSKQGTDT